MSKRKLQDRAVKTQQAILNAAGELFSSRGFHSVTMREIADKAGCSHTAIYLYFKNKMSLLQELAAEPLACLLKAFQAIKEESAQDPAAFIKNISLRFVTFAFEHRNMYDLLLTTAGERVDTAMPAHQVNRMRIELFSILQSAVQEYMPTLTDEQALQHARMFFYMLHGLIKTYADSEESTEELLVRLIPICNEAMDVMLLGIRERHR